MSVPSLCRADMRALMRTLCLSPILATDSVTMHPSEPLLTVISVEPLIATAIQRAHRDESLADLRAST